MAKSSRKDDLARKPRGFPDRRERQLALEHRLIRDVTEVYERWGFEALETGAFEYADSLGKFLPDADRPNEGVFALEDDDEQWISLRYDLTAPLARFAAENWMFLPKPYRRYAAGPVWRNEKPGPGRFREFLQCDADTVGSASPLADAEMIAMAAEAMAAIGMDEGEYVIRVNTRQVLNGVLDRIDARSDGQQLVILRALDKLDRLGVDGVADLLGEGRKDASGDFTKGAGLSKNAIETVLAFAQAQGDSRNATLANLEAVAGGSASGDEGLTTLRQIDDALSAMGLSDTRAVFDPSVVRGLEYYTGAVFEAELLREVTDENGGVVRIGSVGGGGRYDDLVSRFRNEDIPATGFSVGISRLATALALAETGSEGRTGPILVLALDKDQMADYFAVVSALRNEGLRAEVYLGASGMRAQMKYADRRGAPAVVIIGEDERAKGVVQVKDLAVGAEKAKSVADNTEWRESRPGQFEVSRDELVARLREIVGAVA